MSGETGKLKEKRSGKMKELDSLRTGGRRSHLRVIGVVMMKGNYGSVLLVMHYMERAFECWRLGNKGTCNYSQKMFVPLHSLVCEE